MAKEGLKNIGKGKVKKTSLIFFRNFLECFSYFFMRVPSFKIVAQECAALLMFGKVILDDDDE